MNDEDEQAHSSCIQGRGLVQLMSSSTVYWIQLLANVAAFNYFSLVVVVHTQNTRPFSLMLAIPG